MRTTIKTILLIAVLALLAASCSAGETDEAAAAEKAATTQEAYTQAFLAQDIDAVMATYSDDVEFINRSMTTRWIGADQMQEKTMSLFNITDPDATEVLESFVSVDGSQGVIHWHWVGENGLGNPIDLVHVQWLEYTDGLISTLTSYWETMDVQDQLMAGYPSSGS
ncbi:MAG: nuclear transport factor 2 family protein [Actinomycetota bacterium]|nr:nuclear transport factor 2 family protein [Actinomycetota bacterium]